MNSNPSDNLVRIGQLHDVPESPDLARRLPESARSRLADVSRDTNSPETRFDCAYAAIRSAADIALLIKGYRTPTNRAGHHQTAIQSLVHTLNVQPAVVRVLDTLRKQRNASDYEGEPVTEAALAECLHRAADLLDQVGDALNARGWTHSGMG